MPLKKCTANGKSGKKFGDKGKCFTGAEATSKAKRQGRAIKTSQGRSSGTSSSKKSFRRSPGY